MKRIIVPLLALVLSGQAVAQVNKCEIDGKTVYQAAACPGGSDRDMNSRMSVHQAPDLSNFETYTPPQRPAPRRSTPSSGSGYTNSLERRNAEVKARARGKVIPGMSERQVTSILGRPDEVDTQMSAGRSCKIMYWWDDHDITDYVRVCNGEVTYSRQ